MKFFVSIMVGNLIKMEIFLIFRVVHNLQKNCDASVQPSKQLRKMDLFIFFLEMKRKCEKFQILKMRKIGEIIMQI